MEEAEQPAIGCGVLACARLLGGVTAESGEVGPWPTLLLYSWFLDALLNTLSIES